MTIRSASWAFLVALAGVLWGAPGASASPAPPLPVRGLAIAAPSPRQLDRFLRFLEDDFAPRGGNLLVLRVDHGFQYRSRPDLGDPQGLSRDDVGRLVEAGRRLGIRLVPQINLLGHQSWQTSLGRLLRVHPEFDETPHVKLPEKYVWPNPDGLYCKSYCPLHPEVHAVVFDLVDELCDAFAADAFHAGMDEVFYLGSDQCPRCRGRDKAELFAGEVRRIRDHLADRKRELWIWGDRLIDGRATGIGEWEASFNGTHPAIDLIPRDVVICDWHYERADPTPAYFALKGLRVVSCPWRKPDVAARQVQDLVRWRAQATAPVRDRLLGVMQTVWSGPEAFFREIDDVQSGVAPANQDTSVARCYLRAFDEMKAATATAAVAPEFERLARGHHQVRLLPGVEDFVFSLYGAPGDVATVRDLIRVMRERGLGNGFDPGPGPHAHSRAALDLVATNRWPVVFYSGGEMQIVGGRAVFGRDEEAALAGMDAAGVFNAFQLGEWGYYFHNLSHRDSWWRDVYGKDYEAFRHLKKPDGLAGYDRRPTGKKECYEVVRDYFQRRSRDLLGRVISVTGHSHYEAYAGEWGARCIGLELGENIAFTQSKLAFARGAARAWNKPWSVQVSPWFGPSCTTSGPLRTEGGIVRGLDAGHSLSFYERLWLHAWFVGAAMVTPENSIAIFFEKPETPWTLTEHGLKAAEVFRFMRGHDRGIPYTPVAVVLDRHAGYNGYMDKPWGILEPTPGDREARDLFDHQLFPGSDHIRGRPDPANPEAGYLRPTPHGEMVDVVLSSAPPEILASYPVLLLVGDHAFEPAFLGELERALRRGTRLLVSTRHRDALGAEFGRLGRHGTVEVLEPWTHPGTGRPTAISSDRLKDLSRDLLPVGVEGDPVQYAVNRTPTGWVVEASHPGGVIKRGDQPARIDPAVRARVVLHPRPGLGAARAWRSGQRYAAGQAVEVDLGPGAVEFVEFSDAVPGR